MTREVCDVARTLDKFQHEVIDFADHRGRIVYADPMGARKTATTLAFLARRPGVHRVCLVVPSAVMQQWAKECWEWFPEAAPWIGQGTKRAPVLRAALSSPKPAVYITTYDAMKLDAELLKGQFDTWVFDEGHRLKGRTTAVAKTAFKLTAKTTNILCVTGTPVLNHPEELWFYLHMMFRKTFRSFWSWAEEHFIITLQHFNGRTLKVIGDYLPGHAEIVRKQLATVMIQREDTELYPDAAWTAPAEYLPQYVDLSDEERTHYDRLIKHHWAQLPGKLITAANKLAETTRLRQLASDWGNLDAELVTGTKVKVAREVVLRLLHDGPVVVFCEYKVTAQRLAYELLKLQVCACLYTGDESVDVREDTKQRFSRGEVDVIIGTYGSMREGVDGLQLASHQMVLVDLLWVAGLVDQAVGRLRRDGQTRAVQVYPIVANKTIDHTVLRALLRKINVVKTLKGQALADIVYGHSFDIDALED